MITKFCGKVNPWENFLVENIEYFKKRVHLKLKDRRGSNLTPLAVSKSQSKKKLISNVSITQTEPHPITVMIATK